MPNEKRRAVSVIGLGAMGSAIARAFLRSGYETTVWNRSPAKANPLVEEGAIYAGSVGEALADRLVTFISLLDYAAVEEVLSQVDAAPGNTLVNLTSGTPDQARAVEEWAREHEVAYLDGSILGDPEQIGTSGMRFYYSGSPSAFRSSEELLRVLGEDVTYFGEDAGLASVYFTALIGLSYEVWLSYLNTLAFIEREGVEPVSFAPVATGVLTPTLGLLEEFARAAQEKDYSPVAGPIRTHAPLMDDLIGSWEARGVATDHLREVQHLLEKRIAAGHSEDGFSSLIEDVKEK